MISGWLQDDSRSIKLAFREYSEHSEESYQREREQSTLSYRQSLKYFVLFVFTLKYTWILIMLSCWYELDMIEVQLVTIYFASDDTQQVSQVTRARVSESWQLSTNQRPVFRSRDQYWPTRGQYSGKGSWQLWPRLAAASPHLQQLRQRQK